MERAPSSETPIVLGNRVGGEGTLEEEETEIMIALQELGKGVCAWRRSQMMIKNEVCPNSSMEPVHCNITTKYLNIYTETLNV